MPDWLPRNPLQRFEQELTDLLAPGNADIESERVPNEKQKLFPVVLHIWFWGFLSGTIIGSYGWVVGARSLAEQVPQMIYSGIKVPVLLMITVVVSIPSFFVINSLFGLRRDFSEVLKAIVSAQAGLAVILFSLTPFAMIWYLSCSETSSAYRSAVLFDALLFGVASVVAQLLLQNRYRRLIRLRPKHRVMSKVWLLVYAFVGIQAGWALRPFIGDPNAPISFFRDEPFGNAYVHVLQMVIRFFSGTAATL